MQKPVAMAAKRPVAPNQYIAARPAPALTTNRAAFASIAAKPRPYPWAHEEQPEPETETDVSGPDDPQIHRADTRHLVVIAE
jgi:hypothetical protein